MNHAFDPGRDSGCDDVSCALRVDLDEHFSGSAASRDQAGGVHEDIFLHEFAHSVDLMALEDLDPDFLDEVQAAYDDALANNLFENTYADDTVEEYWAEGVQTWFNTNLESDPPNGLHNSVNTRAELESYDPALHGLISRIFPTDYDGGCP